MIFLILILQLSLLSGVIYYLLKFVFFLRKFRRLGKSVDQFPMDEKHWLTGHLNKFSRDERLSYLEQLAVRYPRACGVHFINFLRPFVVVHHPDTVKVVVKACGVKALSNSLFAYAKRWFGEGLLCSNGEKWFRNRRLLTPMFHFEALKHYIKIHHQAAEMFLMNLAACAKNKTEADVQKLSSNLGFDVILRCAMSYHSRVQEEGVNHFYTKAVGVVSRLWLKRLQ